MNKLKVLVHLRTVLKTRDGFDTTDRDAEGEKIRTLAAQAEADLYRADAADRAGAWACAMIALAGGADLWGLIPWPADQDYLIDDPEQAERLDPEAMACLDRETALYATLAQVIDTDPAGVVQAAQRACAWLGEERNTCSKAVATRDFAVSESTLKRHLKEGRLTDLRIGGKGPLLLNRDELARIYPRK
ncbi:MAG: hypothetical protein ACLFUJ_07115 [Phycisphaerae bacterium]